MLNDEQVVVVWTHQTKIEIQKLYNLEKIDKKNLFGFSNIYWFGVAD